MKNSFKCYIDSAERFLNQGHYGIFLTRLQRIEHHSKRTRLFRDRLAKRGSLLPLGHRKRHHSFFPRRYLLIFHISVKLALQRAFFQVRFFDLHIFDFHHAIL